MIIKKKPIILILAVVVFTAFFLWGLNKEGKSLVSYEIIDSIKDSYALIEITDYDVLCKEKQYQSLDEQRCYFSVGQYGEIVANQINLWNNYDMLHAGLMIGWLDRATYQQQEESDTANNVEYFDQCVETTKENCQVKICIFPFEKAEMKEVFFINTGNNIRGKTQVICPTEIYSNVYITDDSMVIETTNNTYYYYSESFPQGFASMMKDFAMILFSASNGSTVFYFDKAS